MTDHGSRTGAARDVPPPRPVDLPASAPPVEETGLGRAARTVADAVAGLLGPADGAPAGEGRRSASSGLRDVLGAVAGAFASGRDEPPTETAGDASGGLRSPAALLGDLLAAVAPRLPIRDTARLRQAHPGASDEMIAEALVARTARLTSAIGAAAGGLAAAHWLAPASLLALPLELGAETLLIAGVELVLIGELHELHGRPADGDARERAAAYLASWSAQRAVDGSATAGFSALLGAAGIRAVQRRITRTFARSVPKAAPFLIGAAIAGRGNRRATETLADRVLADLRAHRHGGRSAGCRDT
jgi:hypothetical protein